MKIETTTNYELFERMDFNRDVTKTRKLEASMKKHGFIPAYPLHCVKEGGKLKIKGGHHRFIVASKLGLPIIYVLCSDNASIHELEDATNNWSMNDYLVSFVRLGDPDYIEVQSYVDITGIAPGMAVSMLGGEMASSGNKRIPFKTGEYKVTEQGRVHARLVANIANIMKSNGLVFAIERQCIMALSRIISAGQIDVDRLKKKIKAFPEYVSKQATVDKYMDMFEAVYNRQTQGAKIPLVMLTNNAIKEREVLVRFKPKPAQALP